MMKLYPSMRSVESFRMTEGANPLQVGDVCHPEACIVSVTDHHLNKTPLEYMLWCYQTGEDLEEMQKANWQILEEEAKKMKDGSLIVIEGQKHIIHEILTRKKLKQLYEYEVLLKGLSSSD